MEGILEYLITSLPALEEPGSTPPLSMQAFLEHVAPSPAATEIAEAIFLLNDLRQFSSLESGELDEPDPIVLSMDQMNGESPLPDYIKPVDKTPPYRIATDAMMAGYYRYIDGLSQKYRCEFLGKWVGWNIAIRNALAQARAKTLEIDPADFVIEPQLAKNYDTAKVVTEWTSAENPLEGMKVLAAADWEWLELNDGWFSFKMDELAAYGVKVMILDRWFRIIEAQEELNEQGSEK